MQQNSANFEIEKKARVRNPRRLLIKLKKLGKFKGIKYREDRYYIITNKKHTKSAILHNKINFQKDPIFRLRIERDKCYLTAKERKFVGKTEINREVEIELSNSKKALWFFEKYLNLKPFVTKKKKTTLFRVKEFNVELNFVRSLGYFIEIEANKKYLSKGSLSSITEKIDKLLEKLDIKEKDVEKKYYIEMLTEKKRRSKRRKK